MFKFQVVWYSDGYQVEDKIIFTFFKMFLQMEAMNLLQNNGMGQQQQQQQQIHQQLPMSQPQLQHQRMLPCPSNQVYIQ